MKVCNFLGKLFIFICFSFISIFNLSASCVKVEDASFVFLPQDGEECTDKSNTGVLTIPNGGMNDFNVLIPGKNDGSYTIELVFDRAGESELSGEQSLFAFYSSNDNDNPVSELILKGSSIFYKVNNAESQGIDLSSAAFDDANIINPHAIIIVHDNLKNTLVLNIDGAELKMKGVPSVVAPNIKNVKIGKNYVGDIGEFRVYGTELALKERAGAVKLLTGMTGAKISAIELVKDENGITRSAINKADLVKCKAGQTVINGECNNATVSGFVPPLNSVYNGDGNLEYNPAHHSESNANILACNIGYEEGGSGKPKYWFDIENNSPVVNQSGECVARDYSAEFSGINNLGDLTSIAYSDSSGELLQLPCQSGYYSDENDGYKFDNNTGDITVTLGGGCIVDNCLTLSNVGSVGQEVKCLNMLIVSQQMLRDAATTGKNTGDYSITVDGSTYTFGDSTKNNDGHGNIFTGQVTDMSRMFDSSDFNEDIGYWNVSQVTRMEYMFNEGAFDADGKFNQDIGGWDVSQVTHMNGMFRRSEFNQDLSGWNTKLGNLTNMSHMFYRSPKFNQDIGGWDVSQVTVMNGMFERSEKFNQDLSGWNINNENIQDCRVFAKDSMLEKDHFPPFDNTLNEKRVGNWCTQPYEL
jgi:surface protein